MVTRFACGRAPAERDRASDSARTADGLAGLTACFWSLRSGQYDDLDGVAVRILIDELIIISIGLQRGIITPTLFAILVVMAIVTTLMATPRFEWTRRKPGITKPAPAD